MKTCSPQSVNSMSDPETRSCTVRDDLERALNGTRGTIEGGDEPITGRVDLATAVPHQLASHCCIVGVEQTVPAFVPDRCGPLCRADDVGVQDCREDAVRLARPTTGTAVHRTTSTAGRPSGRQSGWPRCVRSAPVARPSSHQRDNRRSANASRCCRPSVLRCSRRSSCSDFVSLRPAARAAGGRRDEARDEHDVERSVADHLVRDRQTAALGISGRRRPSHARESANGERSPPALSPEIPRDGAEWNRTSGA